MIIEFNFLMILCEIICILVDVKVMVVLVIIFVFIEFKFFVVFVWKEDIGWKYV